MRGLRQVAVRRGQEAVVGLAAAAGLALLVEAGRRVFPSMTVTEEDVYVLRMLRGHLATKPGAHPELTDLFGINTDRRPRLGQGTLLFQEGSDWFFARYGTAKADKGDKKESRHQLTVYALTGGRPALRRLAEAANAWLRAQRDTPMLFRRRGSTWAARYAVRPRPLNSVVLQAGLAERVLEDIRGFLADKAWYTEHHVPYRRGYLFSGPPGSGKTTLAGALAHELGLSVYIISLADKTLTDTSFAEAVEGVHGVLVIEDIDAMDAQVDRRVEERWESEAFSEDLASMTHHPAGSLTLAGILNTLDGLGTPDGLLVIMTTNHPERLDPALIRPGRVDLHAEIGLASQDQAERMYRRFFPEAPAHLARQFAAGVPAGTLSPAVLQEHLVRHRHDPTLAAQALLETV